LRSFYSKVVFESAQGIDLGNPAMGGYFSEYSIDRGIIFIYEKSVAPKRIHYNFGEELAERRGS